MNRTLHISIILALTLCVACSQAEAVSLWKKAEASKGETAALRAGIREDARMLRLYADEIERTLGASDISRHIINAI